MRSASGRLAVALAVGGMAALFHAWYAWHGLALFDLGILVDGAARTLDGQLFARDFQAPYGPIRYWLLAATFKVFGARLATWCALAVVLQALVAAAVFHFTWRRSRLPGAVLATLAVMVAHGSMHKSFLLLAAVLVLGALHLAFARPEARPVRAGLLLGLAGLVRYDAGVFGLVAVLVGCWFRPPPRRVAVLGGILGGALALVVPVILGLLAAGVAAGEWWSLTLQRVAVQERIDFALPPLRHADGGWGLGGIGVRVLLGALLLLYGTTLGPAIARRVRRAGAEADGLRVGTAVFGLFLLNQARLIPSANHAFQALVPAAVLAGWQLAGTARGRGGTLVLTTLTGLLVAYVHFCTAGPYPGSYTVRRGTTTLLDLPRAGVHVGAAEARDLRQVVRLIQEQVPADGAVATGPGCALLAFLSERRLGVPFAEPSYYYRSERFQQRVIDTMEEERPALFVHDRRPSATYVFEDEAPLVARYVQEHYLPWHEVGPFVLMQRR